MSLYIKVPTLSRNNGKILLIPGGVFVVAQKNTFL